MVFTSDFYVGDTEEKSGGWDPATFPVNPKNAPLLYQYLDTLASEKDKDKVRRIYGIIYRCVQRGVEKDGKGVVTGRIQSYVTPVGYEDWRAVLSLMVNDDILIHKASPRPEGSGRRGAGLYLLNEKVGQDSWSDMVADEDPDKLAINYESQRETWLNKS